MTWTCQIFTKRREGFKNYIFLVEFSVEDLTHTPHPPWCFLNGQNNPPSSSSVDLDIQNHAYFVRKLPLLWGRFGFAVNGSEEGLTVFRTLAFEVRSCKLFFQGIYDTPFNLTCLHLGAVFIVDVVDALPIWSEKTDRYNVTNLQSPKNGQTFLGTVYRKSKPSSQ